MATIWIDIKNSHEPAFFKPFINKLQENYTIYVTALKYAEVVDLLNKHHIKNTPLGKHYNRNLSKKLFGYLSREFQLYFKVPQFDFSMHHMSPYCTHVTQLRRREDLCFTDNDIAGIVNKISYKYVSNLITPTAIPIESLIQQGAKEENIYQYNGFKEDVYVADFKPDPHFLENLPFDDFITIRPESLQAVYVPKGTKSIVPDLIKVFNKENINILFLPRYPEDKKYSTNSNVFIPESPLNGLDICWYSSAVLTGAGTFTREAACMGIPAVSFYPGKFLAVDKKMIEEKKIFHSRDVNEIVNNVLNSKKRKINLEKSKTVQKEVFNIVETIIEEIQSKKKSE